MKERQWFLAPFLLILFAAFSARGQYRFDSWTTDDGLPQNSVNSIAQTSDGYLWFTTLDGLVRFDGVKFKVFDKSNSKNFFNNRLRHVFVDAANDTLWIATENGGLMRRRNGEFRHLATADGFGSGDVIEMQKDADGSLLIVTVQAVLRTNDGENFTLERRRASSEYRMYFAASGTRWEINAAGLTAARNGETIRYPLPFSVQPPFDFQVQTKLFEDRRGILWLTAAGNLYRLENGEFKIFTSRDGMPASRVRAIVEDADGSVWIGTEKDGACRFADNRVSCFGTKDGLSSDNVLTIFLDREKTLWIGTNENGVNRVSRQIITTLSEPQGLFDKNVFPILEDRAGNFWIGTSGLSKYAGGKITNYAPDRDLIRSVVQSLYEDRDGRLWVGCIGGMQIFENGRFADFNSKLGIGAGGAAFWDIHQARDGAMWFATSVGVIKYANGAATHYTARDGLPDDDIKAILETKDGALWFGTVGGAARLENGKFAVFTEKDGLAGNYVRSIYEDTDGALWFGTYDSGLSRLKDGVFTKITPENGLFSNGVFEILEDSQGNFWMSSNQGIYRVAKRQLNDFADGRISSIVSNAFGKSDGMLSTECNGGRQPAGIRASDGKLWFPTQNGAAIVDPQAVSFNPLPPPVVIENVIIENKPVENFQSAIGNSQSAIEIAPGQNNLEIIYTGLSLIKSEQVRFRYKMEGLGADWTEAGTRRSAYFSHLPPGDYTFTVIAANSDNVWNATGESIRLRVVPPFYRTWWFYALAGFGLVGLAFAVYRRRVSQLTREKRAQQDLSRRLIELQEQERKRIAAELHDSLSQNLVIIKNRAMMSLSDRENAGYAFEQIEEIADAAGASLVEVREIAHNLRPFQIDRLGLTKAIEALARKANSPALRVEAGLDKIDGRLSPASEIHLYRIVQECLNNIIKHSGATIAEISIKEAEGFIEITIADNGRGFDANSAQSSESANGSGFGLMGINERARILGASPVFESEPDGGTKIFLKIPF